MAMAVKLTKAQQKVMDYVEKWRVDFGGKSFDEWVNNTIWNGTAYGRESEVEQYADNVKRFGQEYADRAREMTRKKYAELTEGIVEVRASTSTINALVRMGLIELVSHRDCGSVNYDKIKVLNW